MYRDSGEQTRRTKVSRIEGREMAMAKLRLQEVETGRSGRGVNSLVKRLNVRVKTSAVTEQHSDLRPVTCDPSSVCRETAESTLHVYPLVTCSIKAQLDVLFLPQASSG